MGHVIAVSGKGGVGKTTLCGLLIQYLCESGKRPVLAVDADAKLETFTEILEGTSETGWLGYNRFFESNLRMTRMD